jgi:hypothetical protein
MVGHLKWTSLRAYPGRVTLIVLWLWSTSLVSSRISFVCSILTLLPRLHKLSWTTYFGSMVRLPTSLIMARDLHKYFLEGVVPVGADHSMHEFCIPSSIRRPNRTSQPMLGDLIGLLHPLMSKGFPWRNTGTIPAATRGWAAPRSRYSMAVHHVILV